MHRDLFEEERPAENETPRIDVAKVVAELEGEDLTDISARYDTIDHLVRRLFSTSPPFEAQ